MARYDNNLDPINLERLEELPALLALEYRTDPGLVEPASHQMAFQIIQITLFGVIAALALRLLSLFVDAFSAFQVTFFFGLLMGLSQYLMGPVGTPKPGRATVMGQDFATRTSLKQLHKQALLWFLLGPLSFVAIVLVRDAHQVVLSFLLLALPVGVLFWLSKRVVAHVVGWVLANPALPSSDARDIEEAWKGGNSSSPLGLAVAQYRRSWVSLGAAFGVCLLVLALSVGAGYRVFAGMFAAFALVGALLFLSLRRSPAGLRGLFRHTWSAVSNFLTYNQHETKAPGVHQSRAGSTQRRLQLLAASLGFLTLVLVPAASYFPALGLFTSVDLWTETIIPIEQVLSGPEQERPIPSRREVLRSLSPSQQLYYENLESRDQKNRYLDAIARARSGRDDEANTEVKRDQVRELARSPEGWLRMALQGTARGHLVFLTALTLHILLSIAVPASTLFLTLCLVGGPLFVRLYEDYELADAEEREKKAVQDGEYIEGGNPEWEGFVRKLQGDRRVVLAGDDRTGRLVRDHLWLGKSVLNDYPVLLHRDILHEHAWFLGNTGAGKTSLAIAPIVSQLIRLAPRLRAEEIARPGRDPDAVPPSIVILDLKGELYLYRSLKREAERAGVPFKWFTTARGCSTFAFNPFTQAATLNVTLDQKIDIILQSLGLDYGEGFGHAHYSEAHKSLATRAFEQKPDIASFAEFLSFLESPRIKLPGRQREDAADLFSLVRSLANHEALNVVPPSMRPVARRKGQTDEDVRQEARRLQHLHDRQMDMMDLMRSDPPQVFYFYLPASLEDATVRRIGRLVLYSLLVAGIEYEAVHGHPGRVYAAVDEFQQIASRNLELFLRQARSKGIALMLANQTTSDLIVNRDDLRATVRGNTRFKQYFAASDPQLRDEIIDSSGDVWGPDWELVDGETWAPGERTPFGRPEPRITKNDVLDMTDHPRRSIVHVAAGSGYTQFGGRPFIMESSFHITKTEHGKRKAAPWPEKTEATLVVGEDPTTSPSSEPAATGETPTESAAPELDGGLKNLRSNWKEGGPR